MTTTMTATTQGRSTRERREAASQEAEAETTPSAPPPARAPLALRDYQQEILQEAHGCLREAPSLLVTAPTGAGKTIILAEILRRTRSQNRRAALLVHRQELLKQAVETIMVQSGVPEPPGVVWKASQDWSRPVTVIAQDTFNSREVPNEARGLSLLIIDEAHHAIAPSWLDTIGRLNPRYLMGFSATPFRQDREPLSPEPFARIIRPITPKDLIDRGILCPARIESPVIYDPLGQPQPVNKAENLSDVYIQAVRYAIAQGRSKILLYVSPNRAETPTQVMAQADKKLKAQGLTSDAITQAMSGKQREAAIDRFKDATGVSILLNYMALTEGTDLPCVDCVIIGRHTLSESTIIQMIGRGLRKHPGKEDCLVLDYTGRTDMTDIIHYWRLDSDKENPPEGGGEDADDLEPPPEKLTKAEMTQLITQFPNQISPLAQAQVDYPWFKPWPNQPILALPLWETNPRPEDKGQDHYLVIQPYRNGTWGVTQLTLQTRGPAPMTRKRELAGNQDAAANLVRATLGAEAPRLSRQARWRTREASQAQQVAWRRLHPQSKALPELLTAGEISDSIACSRFQARVNPAVLGNY